jgi:MerR family transcriptional regulator, light-induced transcriptional regulator
LSPRPRRGAASDDAAPHDEDFVTLPEAATRLGVHYMTVYRYVRTGMLPAVQRNGRWEIAVDALAHFAARTTGERRSGRTRRAPYRERLVNRLLASDTAGAWNVVERALASGTSPRRAHLELIAPALDDIGERWATGSITIGDEHAATAVASRLIGRLGPLLTRRGPTRGTVVLTGAPGERHTLPMVMLADLLRADGWDVVELGGDTPADDLADAAARADRLVAVAISVGSRQTARAAADAADRVRDVADDVPVLIGGPGVADAKAARRLGSDGWGRDADDVSDLLETLTR